MIGKNPPIGSKGIFELKAPFKADPKVTYTLQATRSFAELISAKIDPFVLVYEPRGLDESKYQEDREAGALIHTLLSVGNAPIHVPSSYIIGYPNMNVVPHSWINLLVDCGLLPDSYDMTRLIQTIKSACSQYVGVETNVTVGRIDTVDAITYDEAEANRLARETAIKNHSTDNLDNERLRTMIKERDDTIAELLDIIENK